MEKWFDYDAERAVPVLRSSAICASCGSPHDDLRVIIRDTNLTMNNKYIQNEAILPHKKAAIPYESGQGQFGIHLITLTAGDEQRQFVYIKDILITRFTVIVAVKHNRSADEHRTKISLTTNVTLPPGRIYYTVGGCPIPFLFPEIRAEQNEPVTRHFLIRTPEDPSSLRFHVETYQVPPDAEVYPEGLRVLKHNIDLQFR